VATFLARLGALDLTGLRIARTAGHTRGAERLVRAYSTLGEHGLGWIALGLAGAALDRGRRPRWRRAAVGVGIAYLANQAVKLAVRRPRPVLPGLPPLMETGSALGFPSAHAACSAAAARGFAGLLPGGPLRLAAAAMAASRLYLGVHYPSDVLAGAALGAVIGGVAR
jgi:decaprenylphosphoryl-5-phosphoribose phosphatase